MVYLEVIVESQLISDLINIKLLHTPLTDGECKINTNQVLNIF